MVEDSCYHCMVVKNLQGMVISQMQTQLPWLLDI